MNEIPESAPQDAKVSDESVVLRRTRATDENAEHLSIRKGEGAAPVADPEPKKD